MKLVELLSVTNENTNVVLFSLNNKVLDIYDGVNSIDNFYNDYEVIEINHTRNDLEIIIDFELEEEEENTKGKYEDLCDYVVEYLGW